MLDKGKDEIAGTGDAGQPRFLQIADALRADITAGTLTAHAALPSERNLSEMHHVSRMTARRALEALEAEGLAYSEDRRGRFVSPHRLRYDISNMISFVADAQAKGGELEIEVVAASPAKADARLAQMLSLPVGSDIYHYTRLFHAGGHAIFMETEYLCATRFPGFIDHDLRQSTTQLLERVYGTAARAGDIVIRMRGVHPDEATLLNIAPSHAAIELEQVICDAEGAAFCFGRQVWRGELAEFAARTIVAPPEDNDKDQTG